MTREREEGSELVELQQVVIDSFENFIGLIDLKTKQTTKFNLPPGKFKVD